MAMAAPLAGAAVEGAAASGAAGAGAAAAGGTAARAGATAGAGSARGSATGAGLVDEAAAAGLSRPSGDTPAEALTRAIRKAQPSQQVAGGLLAALVAYPVLLNFLQGGTPQVKRWFRAKFLNDTGTGNGSAASSTSRAVNTALAGSGAVIVNASTGSGAASGNSSAAAAAGSSGTAATAIAFARAQIGKPYRWGATGPGSYDCSGLMQAAFKAAGVSIPRTTAVQIMSGRAVAQADIQPGDLVFPKSGHVGIATGSGKFVEAPRTGLNVREVPIWGFKAARRYT